MSKFIDSLDQHFDNYEVLPHYDWHVIGMGRAKKQIRVPRWCAPNCEFFKEDWDHTPLCFESCRFWTFDKHVIEAGDSILNVIFAVSLDDPTSTYCTWVSEEYLKKLLGTRYVNKMIEKFQATFFGDQEYTIKTEQEHEDGTKI
jgi:hypothetical protein